MDEETPETTTDVAEVELLSDTDPTSNTVFGLTGDDVGQTIVKTILTVAVMGVMQLGAKMLEVKIHNRKKSAQVATAVDETLHVVDTTSTET